MQNLKVVLPVFIALLFIFTPLPNKPSRYYVDKLNPNSSDENPGTENAPWATIQKGVSVAKAGDTVYVKYAVYNEDITMVRGGNEKEGYISFIGLGNRLPIIDGTDRSRKLIYWHGTSDGGAQKNYIEIQGFEIKDAVEWAIWVQGDNNIIKNCKIHDSGSAAIQLVTGSNNIFSHNEIYNSGWNGISWESNNSNSGLKTDNNIIEYNYIHDLPNHVAVNGFPNESSGNWNKYGGVGNIVRFNKIFNCLEGLYFRYEKEMKIYDNLIVNIYGFQGIHFHATPGDASTTYDSNSKIYNNVIASCKQNGIFNTNAKNLEIINNIFYNNSEKNTFHDIEFKPRTESAGNILNYNLYYCKTVLHKQIDLYGNVYTIPEIKSIGMELNGMFADPLFVDTINDNYSLLKNSPAIDAGLDLSAPFNIDLDGITRPQGAAFDIGAYEIVTDLGKSSH
jgi:hypothetical protein